MKQRFTLFQKIMTVIFIALEAAVLACDVYRLVFVDGDGKYYYIVNLVLSVLLLGVFLMLIFDPKLCISDDETDDPQRLFPIVSASRTYMCFIAVDVSAIFAFVMFAAKYFENPALIVVIGGVAVFVIGAVKYVIDSGRIGIVSEDESEQEKAEDTEKTEETAEAAENTEDKEEAADNAEEAEEAVEDTEIADSTEEVTDEAADTAETEETAEAAEETEEAAEPAESIEETAEAAESTEPAEITEDTEENTDEPLEEKAGKVSQTE